MINVNSVKAQNYSCADSKNKSNKYFLKPTPHDTVSFTANAINVQNCINELEKIKIDGRFSERKFEKQDLDILKDVLNKDNSKWELVKKLSNTKGIGSKTVTVIACCYDKDRSQKVIQNFNNIDKLKDKKSGLLSKFSDKELNTLKIFSLKNVENFDKIIKMAKSDIFNAKEIISFAKKADEKDILETYNIIKDNTYKQKYSESLKKHSKYDIKTLNNLYAFSKTNLSEEDIFNIKKLAGKDFPLIANIVRQTESKNPQMSFVEDKVNENAYILKIKANTNNGKSIGEIFLSEKEGFTSARITDYENKQIYSESKDLRTNIVTKRVRESESDILLSEMSYEKDKNKQIKNKTIIEKSDIIGAYNVYKFDENGNKVQTSSANIDKNGNKIVKKKLKSLDGTITNYNYTEDKKGNRKINYTITDNTGKELYKLNSTFEVIDKNTFRSTKNGKTYNIKFSDDQIEIENILGKQVLTGTRSLSTLLDTRKPENIIKCLKTVSGEDLMRLILLVGNITNNSKNSGSFNAGSCRLNLPKADLFIFSHELGHAFDFVHEYNQYNLISENSSIRKTYKEELKRFNEHFSQPQKDSVEYFINRKSHYNGDWGGLGEIAAETNAIMHSLGSVNLPELEERAHFLQQYFPKTIAKIANKYETIVVPRAYAPSLKV